MIQSGAIDVLRGNDLGRITAAAPDLYPHQWSWDSAFNAMAIGQYDAGRAVTELASLLQGQWRNGMIPHIVFSERGGYFPGPSRWASRSAPNAPRGVETSGICQPPVHAIALWLGLATSSAGDRSTWRGFLEESYSSWVAWHEWLFEQRAGGGSTLMTILHSWESGMDNSPRWDSAYESVEVGELEPFVRLDLEHVTDPAERPTDAEYRRYLWIVQQLRSVGYEDGAVRDVAPFQVGDVFFSAVFSLASVLLAQIGEEVGRDEEAQRLREYSRLMDEQIRASVNPATGLAQDRDHLTGEWISATEETIAGFAPLIIGHDPQGRLLETLFGDQWLGDPGLAFPLPPTTRRTSPAFVPRSYWRGPQWPIISWFLTFVLERNGLWEEAQQLREAGLAQLQGKRYPEYLDPVTNEGLGSMDQSWTAAAVVLWGASYRASLSKMFHK